MSARGIRRLIILLIGVALIAALAAGGIVLRRQARDRALLESREEGIRLAESGEYAAGLDLLGPYVARYRGDEQALLAYAECRLNLPLPNARHLASATSAVRQASEANPSSIAPLEFLIVVYAATEQQTELLSVCDRALGIDPDCEAALDARVFGLIRLDRLEEAREAAEEFIERYPGILRSALARVAVLAAEGADAEEIDAFLRSERFAARLGDQVVYHLRIASAAAEAGERGSEDGFARALASARKAAEMPQVSPLVAAETTSLLRRLAERTGDADLRNFATETVDRRIEDGSLGTAYAALESWSAWWRLDTQRAKSIAASIDPETDDAASIGWRIFLMQTDDDNGSTPSGTTSEARFWASIVRASQVSEQGGSPSEVSDALDDASRLAPGLDVRKKGTYHRSLVAFVRSAALAAGGQGETSLSELERENARLVSDERAVPLRLLLSIADLRVALGDLDEASRTIDAIQRRGVDDPAMQAVVNRYLDRRLRDTSRTGSVREAMGQLERIESLVAQAPDDPTLTATHARLLLLVGRRDEGLAESRRLIGLEEVPTDADLAELVRLTARFDRSLASSLLDLSGDAWPSSVDLIEARARLLALGGEIEEGLAVFDSALSNQGAEVLTPEDRVRTALLRAAYLEQNGLGDPVRIWSDLSDEYPSSAVVQNAALESVVLRDDEPTVRSIISRLREAAGDDSLEWRIASLRADLSFLPDDPEERAAILSKTILGLRAIQDRAPDIATVRRLTAIAYDQAGETEEAARALRGAATVDAAYYPDFVRYLLSHGYRDEANRALDAFLSIPWEQLRVDDLRHRANLLQSVGRLDAALADRRVLARGGQAEDLADLGMLFALLGMPDDAAAVAESLVGPDRQLSAVSAGTGVLLEAGLVDGAVKAYLGARGESPETRLDLARLLLGVGAWDRAIAQIRTSGIRDEITTMMLAHAFLEAGRWDEARAELQSTAERSNRSVRALAVGIETAVTAADPAGVAVRNESVVGLTRAYAAIRAMDTQSLGGIAEAIESFLLGETGTDSMLAELRAQCADGPARRESRAWLAMLAASAGDESAMERTLRDAAEAMPRLGWPFERLCDLYLSQGRLDEAESAANRLVTRLGGDPFAVDVLRAQIAARRGRAEAALNWLLPHRDGLVSGSGPFAARRILIAGLAVSDRLTEADRLLGAIEDSVPEEAAGLYLDAFLAAPSSAASQRRDWLVRANTLSFSADRSQNQLGSQTLGRAWAVMARSSGDRRDATRAADLLTDAIASAPRADRLVPGLELASIEVLLGEAGLATERYESLVEDFPDSALLRNNFASALANELGDPERALAEAREAMRLARLQGSPPRDLGVVGHTLGVAHRRLGELEDSARVLEAALETAGPTPDVVVELGEVLAELRRAEEARSLIRRYPQIDGASARTQNRWQNLIETLDSD